MMTLGNPIQILFKIAAVTIWIYTAICFVRIIITWLPGINYSSFGRFLSQICDPYLNFFSRLPLRIGALDFTPVFSLGLLTLVSSILAGIATSGKIYIGGIIAQILSMLWSIVSSFVGIMFLLFFIRYCVAIFNKSSNSYNSPWKILDNSISRLVFNIARLLSGGKPLDYKKALLFASITLLFLLVAGNITIRILILYVARIPF